MSGVVFALLLFGCSDDGTACSLLATQPKTYSSQLACEADQASALQSSLALRSEQPSVFAECLPASILASLGRGPIDLRTLRRSRQTRVAS
jgi:hypothetical protein